MKRERLPRMLCVWLENRGFEWIDESNPRCLTEDEIYNAAIELQDDMRSYGNRWEEGTTAAEKAVIDGFVEREGKTHKRLNLSEWYNKGC